MAHANTHPCALLRRPTDPQYAESIRRFQGCPTLAITRGGRIYAGWYAGGTREPHIENYNLLVYSDDLGMTWSQPVLIIPSDEAALIHALDIQLWIAPDGRLHVYWVQNNVERAEPGKSGHYVDGYLFNDHTHAEWVSICENPDAAEPVFSAPRCLDKGFLRCKPLALSTGRWLNFNYSQDSIYYEYSISDDQGRTYRHLCGAEKIATPFDETMAYERRDGSVRMLARTYTGELAESTSPDGGETWTTALPSGIANPNTRFFIARTPSGRVLLVNNDHRHRRCNMTLYLSEDDGATWAYKRCIDTRDEISYPDADFYDGRIYLIYDRERCGAKEILFLSFTEENIMDARWHFEPRIISKP